MIELPFLPFVVSPISIKDGAIDHKIYKTPWLQNEFVKVWFLYKKFINLHDNQLVVI